MGGVKSIIPCYRESEKWFSEQACPSWKLQKRQVCFGVNNGPRPPEKRRPLCPHEKDVVRLLGQDRDRSSGKALIRNVILCGLTAPHPDAPACSADLPLRCSRLVNGGGKPHPPVAHLLHDLLVWLMLYRTIRPSICAAWSISFSFHAAKPRNKPCSRLL